jgi:hypothetical protein
MNLNEIQHRDRVLRAYFEGRNWDHNNEFALKRKLILNSKQILPQFPYVIDDEWEVEPSRTDQGRGDLLFSDGVGNYAVVEVKWIVIEGNGRKGTTKRTGNRKKRRDVEKQAIAYADILLKRLEQAEFVAAYIFTNELDRPQLQNGTENQE